MARTYVLAILSISAEALLLLFFLFAALFCLLLHDGNLLSGVLPVVVHLSISANLLYLCHVEFLLVVISLL